MATIDTLSTFGSELIAEQLDQSTGGVSIPWPLFVPLFPIIYRILV